MRTSHMCIRCFEVWLNELGRGELVAFQNAKFVKLIRVSRASSEILNMLISYVLKVNQLKSIWGLPSRPSK